jgi:transposase
MSHVDTTSPFLPLPDGIVIASVHPTASRLVVQVACCYASGTCPLCQQPSERVHGAYVRTVADLPCASRHVILALTVRKFVSHEKVCKQK